MLKKSSPMQPNQSAAIKSSLEDLIPVVNRLQDVFHTIGQDTLDLPQIVVIGSQSSGKSSVLENIVQKDFLPRGKDIVTRRPLVMQLNHSDCQEYAEFLHIPGRIFHDFKEVCAEIERETERLAGSNKGISRIPINLKIYSHKVPNLTLVDLPGLTKIPVGDQPLDIETQIRKLTMEFISKPNSIILAVSPANQDIANSDALKFAKEVDPEGKRTVGVLTKLDLMDAGTNAYEVLMGQAVPLKLGYVGVVNRSQQDIFEKVPIGQSLRTEEEFFRNHPAYRNISGRCGTAYLTRTLHGILLHHIREKLPELKARLNMLIIQTEQELASYGDPAFSGSQHQGSLVLRLITKFSSAFNSSIDGTYAEISTSELCGGARLYYIFNSIFGQSLETIDPCAGLTVQDMKTAIRNSTGPRPSLFVPEAAFDLLIKPQIRRLELPCLRCVELVFDEMLKIINSCETKEMLRFPKLHQKIIEVVSDMLRERMAPTQSYIESLIAIQLAYINTNHPDFIGGSAAIAMLERKHERRRKEFERHRKHGVAFAAARGILGKDVGAPQYQQLSQPVPTAQPHHHEESDGGKYGSSAVTKDSRRQAANHGKDGGFLTYFFGNPQNVTDSASSRSNSPVRQSNDFHQQQQQQQPVTTTGMSAPSATLDENMSKVSLNRRSDEWAEPNREDIEIELIRSLIHSYFSITRKTVADLIPKTLMHMIVNNAKENIQNRLVSALYKEDMFNELLMEDEQIMAEREKCKRLLDVYRKGSTILQDIF